MTEMRCCVMPGIEKLVILISQAVVGYSTFRIRNRTITQISSFWSFIPPRRYNQEFWGRLRTCGSTAVLYITQSSRNFLISNNLDSSTFLWKRGGRVGGGGGRGGESHVHYSPFQPGRTVGLYPGVVSSPATSRRSYRIRQVQLGHHSSPPTSSFFLLPSK